MYQGMSSMRNVFKIGSERSPRNTSRKPENIVSTEIHLQPYRMPQHSVPHAEPRYTPIQKAVNPSCIGFILITEMKAQQAVKLDPVQ